MIRIKGLKHHLIEIPDLHVEGEIVAVIGRNGSGKTSFLELLAGIDNPLKGEILLGGKKPRDSRIGWVGEFPDRTMLFSRVYDEVASSMRFQKFQTEETDLQVRKTMSDMGIARLLDRSIIDLSGGEKAMVACAAAMVSSPDFLILDEVDSHLDGNTAEMIHDIIKRSNRRSIYCTHYMDHAADADQVIFMDSGKIIHHGTPEDVFSLLEGTCFYPSLWRLKQ